MTVGQLQTWAQEPETHQKIVGSYAGGYSLGVTDNPPAFVLRVQSADVAAFPTVVTLHGVSVPVTVHGNFAPPVPLAARP